MRIGVLERRPACRGRSPPPRSGPSGRLSSWCSSQLCVTGLTSVDEMDREHARRRIGAARDPGSRQPRSRRSTSASMRRSEVVAQSLRTSRRSSRAWCTAPASAQRVVAALEPVEDLDQQLEPVALDDSRPPATAASPTLTPIPSTTWPEASARMPATFRPSTRTSFGCLIARPRPIASATASRRDERQLGPAGDRRRGLEHDREREPGSGLVDPDPPEPSPSRSLVLGERDRAVRRRRLAASSGSTGSRPRRDTGRPKLPRSRGTTISGTSATPSTVVPAVQPPSSQGRPIDRGEPFGGTRSSTTGSPTRSS